ncbi:DUF5666 domain-containing protein [Roseateles saccharophilus]|uniref:DUF5666 domain-containing protein n=1 Tax=Roseateles saccharophilus TaxID=304 RepID=A0A4R3UR56_ROSSA|nr:DUF5666 domain-containing protein [Roseateles saccharophilus]MDG0833274.1 hypothetical protein [Roseateles saccharophilus]TCU94375.1 hypothetical protein EV671_101720 [Roseateles saccharophilus]
MRRIIPVLAASLACAFWLASCGGGGGSAAPATPSSSNGPAASTLSASSGEITAFGSVFVNGHEFSTQGAKLVDNDTGETLADASALEVGMSVDVKPMSATALDAAAPQAAEIRLHPLARGYVDAATSTASTLTVMGQTVQLTSATNFSDRRACVTATTSPCTPVSGLSGLSVTSAAAVPGSYVTVHGFLFSAGSGGANIVATLVSVGDAPTGTSRPAAFKAEGSVLSTGTNSVTIGSLAVSLAQATCWGADGKTSCATAFSTGQVVSVYSATAPALPATSFSASTAALRSRLPVETVGATVEVQGRVSSTSGTSFVLRGISVDGAALAAADRPVVGDDVRVTGTVATGGAITASAIKLLHAAISRSLTLEGDYSAVAAGTSANTWVVTLMGQSITVDASTRLSDRTSWTTNFNITTFQSVLSAASSKHLVVSAAADASGMLTATNLRLMPASTRAGLQGIVDATPAPVTGTGATAPTTFSVHGIAVSADPATFASLSDDDDWRLATKTTTVVAGDLVLVRGSFVNGQLVVAVPAGHTGPTMSDFVVDLGPPRAGDDHCDF